MIMACAHRVAETARRLTCDEFWHATRILRPYPGKTTAEVYDYHDIDTRVLASSLAKRAPGYLSLGFPAPRASASRR